MNWTETSADFLPAWLVDGVHIGKDVRIFRCGMLTVFVATEEGKLHLSISHPMRHPNWDEIKAARYDLLPDEKTFALLLPPMEQYVNQHKHCFHLHEIDDER